MCPTLKVSLSAQQTLSLDFVTAVGGKVEVLTVLLNQFPAAAGSSRGAERDAHEGKRAGTAHSAPAAAFFTSHPCTGTSLVELEEVVE